MSAHTPGPWHQADAHGPSAHGFAVGSDGDNWLICETTGYYGRDTRIANARLIAAAPDLLAALRVCVDALDETDDYSAQITAAEEARAAIAKATS